jgi:hypothetical protein
MRTEPIFFGVSRTAGNPGNPGFSPDFPGFPVIEENHFHR